MIVTNRPLTERLARVISEIFTDVIIAPDFEADARAILQKKKNLRLMQVNMEAFSKWQDSNPIIRSAPGGLMVMDRDIRALGLQDLEEKSVTKRPPSKEELEAMRFTWKVCKHVKSNAIVFGAQAGALGLQVNAGHGITTGNLPPLLAIPHLHELNIGHHIISRAIQLGLRGAVSEMLAAMRG